MTSSVDPAQARRGSGSRPSEPVVITAAEMSYDEQLRMRRRRYALMMSMRVPLLLAGFIVFATLHIVWLSVLLVVLSVPLPWMAVLIANDRPARTARQKVVPGVVNYERALTPGQREIVDSD